MKTLTTTVDDDGVVYKTFQAFFKTPYNHDTNQESDRTGLSCKDPSLAQQHERDETDINVLVERFGVTRLAQMATQMPPSFADFSEVFDFQSALNAINDARDSFMALPAKVRATFDNDPAKFVGYVDHCLETGDISPLRKLGLAVPERPGTEPPPEPPSGDTPAPKASETAPKGGNGDKQ